MLFFFKADNFEYYNKFNESDYNILSFSIINISEEIINDIYEGYCFEYKHGEFGCVISVDKYEEQELLLLGKQLADVLRNI